MSTIPGGRGTVSTSPVGAASPRAADLQDKLPELRRRRSSFGDAAAAMVVPTVRSPIQLAESAVPAAPSNPSPGPQSPIQLSPRTGPANWRSGRRASYSGPFSPATAPAVLPPAHASSGKPEPVVPSTAAAPPAAAQSAPPPPPPPPATNGSSGASAPAPATTAPAPAPAPATAAATAPAPAEPPPLPTGASVSLSRLYKDRVETFKARRLRVSVDMGTHAPDAMASLGSPAEGNPLVNRLPRGGWTVDTKIGTVQVGCPPETIKDHMSMGLTVPTFYVVPHQRFDARTFVNLAEIEFPTFFNFFVLKKRVKLIGTADGIRVVRTVFRESLLGPEGEVDTSAEFDPSIPEASRPVLRKELDWFARDPMKPGHFMNIDTLLDTSTFERPSPDEPEQVDLGSGVIIQRVLGHNNELEYVFIQDGAELARVPDRVALPDLTRAATALFRPFQPPTFGFTFLGTSHGFDPDGQTTGFVIWINGQGVMVDPPPNSSLLLQTMGIPPRLVDTVILTHCHADHDAGTLQKVLEEGQVTIMTTPTVLGSFIRKYATTTGIADATMRELFKFRPVTVGAFMPLRNAHFRFFYALHAVPCVGFEVHLGGKSMVYSADTFNDPEGVQKMFEAGYMSKGRRDALVNFPWYHTIVVHEAGVPPIHTPVAYLASLPDDVKRRLRLVHVAPKAVPRGKGLQLAREGPEHTIRIDVDLPPLAQAVNVLDLVSYLRFLHNLSLSDARALVQLGYVRTFNAGRLIAVRELGAPCLSKSAEFFVVANGLVRLDLLDAEHAHLAVLEDEGTDTDDSKSEHSSSFRGYFTTGDYFPRDVLSVRDPVNCGTRHDKLVAVAQTTVQVVVFNEYEFWQFLQDRQAERHTEQLTSEQNHVCSALISANAVLRTLTDRQARILRTSMQALTVPAGVKLWNVGQAAAAAVLIASGDVLVESAGSAFSRENGLVVGRGAFLAELPALRACGLHTTSAVAVTQVHVFVVPRVGFLDFLKYSPSFLLRAKDSLATL